MTLPLKVDLTTKGKVQPQNTFGEKSYFENEECELHLLPTENGVEILYMTESGALLTDEQVKSIIDNLHNFTN